MLRRGILNLVLSILLPLSALSGGAGAWAQLVADGPCPLTAPAKERACPCQASQTQPQPQHQAQSQANSQADNACHCPTGAPCQVERAPLSQAPEMVLAQLDWPQAPGLTGWGLAWSPQGPAQHLLGRPVPPSPPPEALYLRKSSLLI